MKYKTIEIEGKTYNAVPSNKHCIGCAFYDGKSCCSGKSDQIIRAEYHSNLEGTCTLSNHIYVLK